MSLSEEKLYWDMMPHRISVRSREGTDDYGKPQWSATARTYRCYVGAQINTRRGTDETEIDFGLSCWCLATPVENEGDPVPETEPVKELDEVEFTGEVAHYGKRPIIGVSDFYDETGSLHNFVLRFS